MKIQLTSDAFAQGQPIPSRHAYEQENISPYLSWSGTPPTTKSLALIVDDPDAPKGNWVHWILYDISPEKTGFPEGLPKSPELSDGAKQGINDYKEFGYGGPCPPPGKP